MNYYNPFFYGSPYITPTPSRGVFTRIFKDVNLSSIINGTQKTLNIINQTLPLIRQASPVINNAKTMFKLMNEFKKTDEEVTQNKNEEVDTVINNTNNPTFFL